MASELIQRAIDSLDDLPFPDGNMTVLDMIRFMLEQAKDEAQRLERNAT